MKKKLWPDKMVARFEAGTFQRIAAISAAEEDRTEFVREAVKRELVRRERHVVEKPAKRLANKSARNRKVQG
jgi:hypothetical protein